MTTRPVMQFDPALKQQILARTGQFWDRQKGSGREVSLPVVAELASPEVEIAGLTVVARFGHVVTGRLEASRVAEVRRHPGVKALKANRAITSCEVIDHDLPPIRPVGPPVEQGPRDFTGRGVTVVAIDWFVDVAADTFRTPEGTRLAFIWDQRGGRTSRSPMPYGYGRVFTRDDIDRALATADPYRALDYDPAEARGAAQGSHGTHVLDIAAGNGRLPGSSPGIAPEARLGFVHLRASDHRPLDNLSDSVRLLEAVRFVLDAVPEGPLVINLSLGDTGGAHSGDSLLEKALDAALVERDGVAIVMSTGNYFVSNLHAAKWIAQGQSIDIPWRLPQRRSTTAELEVWYAAEDRLAVDVLDPSGETILSLAPGDDGRWPEEGRPTVAGYSRLKDSTNGDNMIDLFVAPGATGGTWTVRLTGRRVTHGTLHVWVERTAPLSQSRIAAEHATRTGTTNTICNGRRTIACGAFDPHGQLARFSSSGPTRDGRRKPDVSAPGVGILAARSSFIANGRRVSNTLTRKSGTSMAAPHVAGTVALLFELALPRLLPIDQTRAILMDALRRPSTTDPVERMRYGAGGLDPAWAVRAFQQSLSADTPFGRQQETEHA